MIVRKCLKCGAVVIVEKDCMCEGCGIQCCGDTMVTMQPNVEDAAAEKHVPKIEKIGDKIRVTVDHVMEDDHYIEWIGIDRGEGRHGIQQLMPGDEPVAAFEYVKGSVVYAMCNKHNLWSADVD